MNPIYEWHYEHYAEPRLSDTQLSSIYLIQSQEWQAVAENLSRHDRLLSYDLMDTLKHGASKREPWGLFPAPPQLDDLIPQRRRHLELQHFGRAPRGKPRGGPDFICLRAE